jgi:hypothetical protein
LLTSFSKALENIIFNWLLAHFNNNNIIIPEQFGFLSNSSAERAAFGLIYEILEALTKYILQFGKGI